MIIKSYLAYSVQGQYTELMDELNALPGCEVIPAINREVLILLTESADDKAEEKLSERLQNLKFLQSLTLVSGHNERVDGTAASATT